MTPAKERQNAGRTQPATTIVGALIGAVATVPT